MTYNKAESLARMANKYNLDYVLDVILTWDGPAGLRRNLTKIYCFAAQAILESDFQPLEVIESMPKLQMIIDALEEAYDKEEAKLAITVRQA